MIQITNLNLQFGDKHLFKDVSARLNESDRVGLIGVNGTGKSTLLKMLVGDIETDFGVVTKSKRATIGYLPQEIQGLTAGRTLYQEAESSFDNLLAIHKELDSINQQLGSADPQSSFFSDLLQQQGELQQQLDESDFFQLESKIEKVLIGLGFKKEVFNKDCDQFSGGWQMRLMIAKLLLIHPAFLFLDEPTNHLDIESLTWLEDFLQSYNGALIIISHDRAFLDNLTTTTWELSLGRLTIYKGNYSAYLTEREIRLEVQRSAYNNQQAKIQQTMRFVTRFRAKSTKAKQVQSRLKLLSKMDKIELDDTEQRIAFRFPPSTSSGRLAIEANSLQKRYESLEVFNGVTFEINRGDKVAIVGVNGAGKSTLVKMLAGLVPQDSGKIRLGHNVAISYFGQHQAKDLAPSLSVLQTMEQIEIEQTITGIRSLLGAFLFRGDEVDKKVMVLSGGEKSRLALAKMIATPANLLIMDEPTNHLDMMSQDVLQDALHQYDGSVVVVSHNRFFLDGFVNKVLEIKDGKATMYDGNLSYYLSKKQEEAKNIAPAKSATAHASAAPKTGKLTAKEERKAKAKLRETKNRLVGPLKKEIAQIEKEIEELEEQKTSLEQLLADPELYQNQEAFTDKSSQYKKVDRQLNRLYPKWEQLQTDLEEAEQKIEVSQ